MNTFERVDIYDKDSDRHYYLSEIELMAATGNMDLLRLVNELTLDEDIYPLLSSLNESGKSLYITTDKSHKVILSHSIE